MEAGERDDGLFGSGTQLQYVKVEEIIMGRAVYVNKVCNESVAVVIRLEFGYLKGVADLRNEYSM